ncbi:LCP family protein [Streptoalloteichus hindustanus]|uniref:Transcriptional attenuator, LytR family n=1 Tax=Streptoalloteichus hindustanus TaxID=2017 RepID=A0A1M5K4C7_STRHI|nr:LCP family protein [Streptoalloteichus hindustanus]SHG47615.1 transcriptional attenuator, LytR family [Streptoalloteichus hindustanus]
MEDRPTRTGPDDGLPEGEAPSAPVAPDVVEAAAPAARRPGRGGKIALAAARTVVALASVAALTVTGIAWSKVDSFNEELPTTDILANIPVPPSTPADDGAVDILLVGSDSRTDVQGNPLPANVLRKLRTEGTATLNTDTVILVRVPRSGGQAHAVSIPRDTSVPIPDYREDKINAAYGVTKARAAQRLRDQGERDSARVEQESDQAGRRALVQVVQELTGVRVDHYAEVNLYGFYLLTEALGGVDVCLLHATSDPNSGARFRAGPQTVSGGDALAFVRQRDGLPRSDLDRIVRQQAFLASAVNKVLSTGTLTDPDRLSGLLEAARRSVVLDQGWDVLGFAQQMQGITAGNVDFTTIPVGQVGVLNERKQSIITVDVDQVRRFVAGLAPTSGGSPAGSSAPSATSSASAPPSSGAPGTPDGGQRLAGGTMFRPDGLGPVAGRGARIQPAADPNNAAPIAAGGVPCVN